MSKLSDSELLKELQERFEQNKKSLEDHKKLMKEMETLNRKLQESEQLKSSFLSNIRNEIVNPLTTLMGLSKNLFLFDWPTKESMRAVAVTIHEESLNLDFQLKNIFTASEIEAGDISPSISNVEIESMINSVIDAIQHKIKQKNIQVSFVNEIPQNENRDMYIVTDPEKIHLIGSNLLQNAVEYSEKGGSIEIKSWLEDMNFKISFKDYGIGIEKKNQEKIFDRFRQLETGTTKNHPGHGLGLSVVKALVELLGGSISVESEKQKGSVFTIILPQLTTDLEFTSAEGNEIFFEEELEF